MARPPPLAVVVLAAGRGTRMRSSRPKVLHRLGGRPLLEWVLAAARTLSPECIVLVHPPAASWVPVDVEGLVSVVQEDPLGSGDAVRQALRVIPEAMRVLVLYGDVPLIETSDLRRLLMGVPVHGLGLLSARLDDPRGYGRILRDAKGRPIAVREERDLDSERDREIREVNTGILAADAGALARWLSGLSANNAQGEYYLTDVVAIAIDDGADVVVLEASCRDCVLGANDARDLARLEAIVRRRRADALLAEGVQILDPERIDVRGTVSVGRDVVIDVDVILEGRVQLGNGVRIGAFSVLRDVVIEGGAEILPFSHLVDTHVGAGARIGPYARLRDGVDIGSEVRIGNFVEIKKSTLRDRTKVSHLSYVGDAQVGRDVNLGAGVITVNYDGRDKHVTVVEDEAFVGCGTQLVAPVTIGKGAFVAAGSTITEDAPAGKLTLARARQVTVEDWSPPSKR